jgi:hypothetical protein
LEREAWASMSLRVSVSDCSSLIDDPRLCELYLRHDVIGYCERD